MSKRVIYSCPFIPPEWIAAHGFEPSRIIPDTITSGAQNGVCPYAHSFTEAALQENAAAIVFTTACDQMRRASETAAARSQAPVFLMNIPHTWQTPGSYRLYRSEIERLGIFLERLTSRTSVASVVSSNTSVASVACSQSVQEVASVACSRSFRETLSQKMLSYSETRQAILDARPNLSARQLSEVIADSHQNAGSFALPIPNPAENQPNKLPIALIGGPLTQASFQVFDLIERAGGYVALDGTETGERTLPAAFDRRRIADDPLGTLTEAYFGAIPDPFRRPNSEFFKWLREMISERGIRGIILHHYLWCDIWRAESLRIAEFTGLPIIELETADCSLDTARTITRLEAFMEVVKQ